MTTPSLNVVRTGKRWLAVALFGLLLATTAAPAVAAGLRPHITTPHPIVHPTDGVGDSPLVP